MRSHVVVSCISAKISQPNWSQEIVNYKSCCSPFLIIWITIYIAFILLMSTGEWTNHNLFKSVETLTSGDHVECKNSSFFLLTTSMRGPIHITMHGLLPPVTNGCLPPSTGGLLSQWRVSSHVFPWWKASSLPWWMAPSLDEQLPQQISMQHYLLHRWTSMNSQPPPYLDEWSPPSPLPWQTVSSFLRQMTSSLDGWPLLVQRCCLRFMIRRWELGLQVVGSSYIYGIQ